jgi:hypothetical protein
LGCFVLESPFYVFPCVKKTGLSSDEFVAKLFDEERATLISKVDSGVFDDTNNCKDGPPRGG